MPYRQSHPPSTSDGLLGGAFVVIGFVALIIIAAVDVISSRWPPSTPSSDTTQDKPGSSITRLKEDDTPSPDFLKDPIKEPNPVSDVKMSENTAPSALIPNPTDHGVPPLENQSSYPLIPDLDDNDAARVEEPRAEVPLNQDQDLRQEDSHTANIHEITVPVTNDSSQEWVSLSRPDAESPSFSNPDVQPESVPTASFVQHVDEGSSSQQQEPTPEFSSSTLVDASTKLHESATTIGSDTTSSSPPPTTPEPDTHSFDHNAASITAVVVHIQADEEKQAPLNPESSLEFGSVSEVLKPRRSTRSLYDSSSKSINRRASGELSTKKKRGGSFIKKSGTLINKVFKNKDASGNVNNNDDDENRRLSSSLDTLEHSTTGRTEKRLTSPSRVSLGSIRSISGSIKKKMGKSSSNAAAAAAAAASKDALISGSVAVSAQDEEPHLDPEHPHSTPSNSSQLADDTSSGPSLLKTMFKVRKPSK